MERNSKATTNVIPAGDNKSIGQTCPINNWVHFMAIGGTGMGAIAGLFKSLGYKVTGSDGPIYPPMSTYLEAQKIPIKHFAAENLDGATWGFSEAHPAFVVVGNALSRNHVECLIADKLLVEKKIQRMSFPQAMGEKVIQQQQSFVVAGTHGKTTTTSLLAWAFEVLKENPGFMVGGIPKNFECGARVGGGNVFVSEGDEYDTAYWDKEPKFLHYNSSWVLATGIEFDHIDIYSNVEAIEESFLKLVHKTREGWVLIDRVSAPRAASVERVANELSKAGLPCLRYGEDGESDYSLKSWAREKLPWNDRAYGLAFEIAVKSGSSHTLHKFVSPMMGRHNLLNAVGVYSVLHRSGYLKKDSDFQEVLQSFKGVSRRQDVLFESETRIVVDDFAHHPTAIRETIRALADRYPNYAIAAFFEPRSATSARNTMYADFVKAFGAAEAVFLQESTKSNVPDVERLKTGDLANEIVGRESTRFAVSKKTVDELVHDFEVWSGKKEKVLALVMSNGAFSGLAKRLIPE